MLVLALCLVTLYTDGAVDNSSGRMIDVDNYSATRQSEYKHVLANILRSRYVARMPRLEARSPGHRSKVENASVTCCMVTNQERARTPRKLGFALYCHSNPNSAQLGGSLYHAPKLHPGPCSIVWAYGRGQTGRHTDRQTYRRA